MFAGRWRRGKVGDRTSAPKETDALNKTTSGQADASDLRRLHLRFVGQVQGVGFRWTSQRVARSLGLTGWVKNEWDGSVSMELQGTDEQISRYFGQFQNQYRDYPIQYTIDEKDDIAPVAGETRFDVRY